MEDPAMSGRVAKGRATSDMSGILPLLSCFTLYSGSVMMFNIWSGPPC